jgi:hypothetical protein
MSSLLRMRHTHVVHDAKSERRAPDNYERHTLILHLCAGQGAGPHYCGGPLTAVQAKL